MLQINCWIDHQWLLLLCCPLCVCSLRPCWFYKWKMFHNYLFSELSFDWDEFGNAEYQFTWCVCSLRPCWSCVPDWVWLPWCCCCCCCSCRPWSDCWSCKYQTFHVSEWWKLRMSLKWLWLLLTWWPSWWSAIAKAISPKITTAKID